MESFRRKIFSGTGEGFHREEVWQLLKNDFRNLEEARDATREVLRQLHQTQIREIPITRGPYKPYCLLRVKFGREEIFVRPINKMLYLADLDQFREAYAIAISAIVGQSKRRAPVDSRERLIDSVLYTMSQTIGIGLDLSAPNANTARKHAGLRFESLVEQLFNTLEVSNEKLGLNLPLGNGKNVYSCEIDRVLSSGDQISSLPDKIDPSDLFLSVKTTSKDRMTKIFTDKILLEQFSGHRIKLAALFLHDVQRSGRSQIAGTFVANNFRVYQSHLTTLSGVYYLDPPPHIQRDWFKDQLKRVSDLIASELWCLL
ncbi:MAG: hypothetical protein KAW84_00890 [Thermoplasmata archaeon]|nr:hypothetical protein [Thermoplasmata archaeon]